MFGGKRSERTVRCGAYFGKKLFGEKRLQEINRCGRQTTVLLSINLIFSAKTVYLSSKSQIFLSEVTDQLTPLSIFSFFPPPLQLSLLINMGLFLVILALV